MKIFKKRFKRPFTEAFMVSWFLANWRVWVLLIKTSDVRYFDAKTQTWVENLVIDRVWEEVTLCRELIIPFISALIYLFIVGWVNLQIGHLRKKWFIEKQKIAERRETLNTELKISKMQEDHRQNKILVESPSSFELLRGNWELTFTQNGNSEIAAKFDISMVGRRFSALRSINNIPSDPKWEIEKYNEIAHVYLNTNVKSLHLVLEKGDAFSTEYLYIEFMYHEIDHFRSQNAVSIGVNQYTYELNRKR